MDIVEIIVIICCILIVGGVLGNYIYKKVKKLPTGECSYCHSSSKKKQNKLLEDYRKKYGSKCKSCNLDK